MSSWPLGCSPSGTRAAVPPRARSSGGSGVTGQLDHGRHAALAALRVWNDPAATFRTESFALLFVTAWNSIAFAVLQREGEEWRDLDETAGPRMVAGRERALETGELIASAFGGDRHLGLRRNVEFWIGFRNQVAHRHLPALDVAILPQAQAGLLNLEGVLEDRFGREAGSLGRSSGARTV